MKTAVKTRKVYEEIIDFIAAGTTPESLINFQLSDIAQERLEDLVWRAKNEGLPKDEKDELEQFLAIEHFITLVKAKAHQYI